MRKTTVKDGKISCVVYGEMTGTDCTCVRNEVSCKNCFIYNSLKEFPIPQVNTAPDAFDEESQV